MSKLLIVALAGSVALQPAQAAGPDLNALNAIEDQSFAHGSLALAVLYSANLTGMPGTTP